MQRTLALQPPEVFRNTDDLNSLLALAHMKLLVSREGKLVEHKIASIEATFAEVKKQHARFSVRYLAHLEKTLLAHPGFIHLPEPFIDFIMSNRRVELLIYYCDLRQSSNFDALSSWMLAANPDYPKDRKWLVDLNLVELLISTNPPDKHISRIVHCHTNPRQRLLRSMSELCQELKFAVHNHMSLAILEKAWTIFEKCLNAASALRSPGVHEQIEDISFCVATHAAGDENHEMRTVEAFLCSEIPVPWLQQCEWTSHLVPCAVPSESRHSPAHSEMVHSLHEMEGPEER